MSDTGNFPAPAGSGDQMRNGPFPVVGVGASAGGLEAFSQLLSALPDNTGMAFVLVQHLDPKHESKLSDLLAKATPMPLVEATQGLAVGPDHVYVIAPNTTLTIAQGVLQLTPRGEARGPHLVIDQFFKSLAEDRQTGAIGVILSGTGTDGTLGLEEIKAAGGITLAQDEQSAKYAGMPQSAVRSGCVDLVLPPAEIARELARISQHPYVTPAETEERGPPAASEEHTGPVRRDDDDFKKILEVLHASFGVDFSGYRDTTIKRRIRRRMVLHTQDSLADYARQLNQDRAELDALYQDILINVTSFFREPETFEALKQSVFPEILESKNLNAPIRIWVPGCSTGQEAYSLAIVLLEFLEEKPVKPAIQLFASDLSDTVSLQKAREGIYPENIEAEVSPERLRRFFTKEDSKYRVSKPIREMCLFARQNVAADPPFSRVDLISCRNLLIYLAPALQKRVIPTFHYALNPTGFLMLGASETVGPFTDLFDMVDQKHRIYVKKATAARQYPFFNAEEYQAGSGGRALERTPAASPTDWQREADRITLGQYAPPGVLVNESLDILQFRGQTGAYLAPPPGEPSHNLFKMAREGLFLELRSALNECRQKGASVRRPGVRVRGEGVDREIDLHVLPVKLPHAGNHCFLILFEEIVRRASPPEEAVSTEPSKDADGSEAALLRQELASTREYLQSVIEQQDATNEELKSANEEILSSNEELQSTNEELETAKEELQSMNEELTTVNEQLQNRNQELSRLGDALTNLQSSANVAMVELDIDLRVRRFTPAATKVLNLLPGDIGRPLDDLRPAVDVPDLKALVTEVIETVQVKEREVRDRNGRWYALRVNPYRTADNRIDGAVTVFSDIDQAKSAQEAFHEARDYAHAIVETVRDPLLVLDKELRVVSANQAFYRCFQVMPLDTEGRLIYELGNRQWNIPDLRKLLEEIIPQNVAIENFEVRYYFPTIGQKVMLLNARRIIREGRKAELILLAIEDITERRQADQTLRETKDRLAKANEQLESRVQERTAELEETNRALKQDMEERKKLEEQLRQAQKMESIGTLAAGVAHDFNNILNIIQGYASVLRPHAAKNEEIAESLNVINEEIKRGGALAQQLLTIGRKTEGKVESTDINALVGELIRLLQQTFPKTIEVRSELNPELPPVMADPHQITQALLNLCVNARDAMPDSGKLTVKTGAVDGKSLQDYAEVKAERYVCIEVTDTGTGIDEGIQSRIYEPFFTTKETGKGTGLGLAVVYGIVQSHNGLIQVESKPMHGATFRLYLPVASFGK